MLDSLLDKASYFFSFWTENQLQSLNWMLKWYVRHRARCYYFPNKELPQNICSVTKIIFFFFIFLFFPKIKSRTAEGPFFERWLTIPWQIIRKSAQCHCIKKYSVSMEQEKKKENEKKWLLIIHTVRMNLTLRQNPFSLEI